MNVVSKYVKEDLDLDNQSFGYILGAFSLAYALFELPTGILGDRIGPRKVLARVVLWWSGFTALTGTAFGFVYLIIVRFLFGSPAFADVENIPTRITTKIVNKNKIKN